jgi:hypothetical protein
VKKQNSKTASNSKKRVYGKPFKKGDERINRKGRPSTFDEFRKLAIDLAKEPLVDKNGNPVKLPGCDDIPTRSKAILLQWAQSTDIRKQEKFIEYAFGKVPQKTEHDIKATVETVELDKEEYQKAREEMLKKNDC